MDKQQQIINNKLTKFSLNCQQFYIIFCHFKVLHNRCDIHDNYFILAYHITQSQLKLLYFFIIQMKIKITRLILLINIDYLLERNEKFYTVINEK